MQQSVLFVSNLSVLSWLIASVLQINKAAFSEILYFKWNIKLNPRFSNFF